MRIGTPQLLIQIAQATNFIISLKRVHVQVRWVIYKWNCIVIGFVKQLGEQSKKGMLEGLLLAFVTFKGLALYRENNCLDARVILQNCLQKRNK